MYSSTVVGVSGMDGIDVVRGSWLAAELRNGTWRKKKKESSNIRDGKVEDGMEESESGSALTAKTMGALLAVGLAGLGLDWWSRDGTVDE